MKEIQLTKGYVALVDDADYELVSQWKWRAFVHRSKHRIRIYAARQDWKHNRASILMHRLIANPGDGQVVDHANGDGLDNRRHNIRVCEQADNCANRRPHGGTATGYKGVSTAKGKFRAKIVVAGVARHLGVFVTAQDAARAYDAAALKARGEFAFLNFPDRPQLAAFVAAVRAKG